MLGNYHDAEEATQETFIRVYQALPRFNGQYRLRPWIAKIATNVCLDMLRARTRANRLEHNGNGNGNGHANGNGNGYGHFPTTEEWAEYQANGNAHTASSVVSSVAASPVTTSVAERVVGVLAAVTVTGAIGVGAVTVAQHHHAAPPKRAPVVAASVVSPPVAPVLKHRRATVVPIV